MLHNGAVIASSCLPIVATSLLRIDAAADQAPLSAQQQLFNAWVQRIADQRAWLLAWDEAVQACRTRFARDGVPLRTRYLDLQAALALYLDQQSARKLSKLERQLLESCLLESAQQVADLSDTPAQRAAMEELVRRYTPEEEDEEREDDASQAAPSAAQAASASDDIDWQDPEAVAQFLEAQEQAAAAQAERARAQHHAKRQQRKAQQAQKAKGPTAAELANQSLREVYRRLASRLHPDREQDPVERARKTALMQRVNIAYEASRLMELLELQWEAEQMDPAKLAQLSDARLAPYNRMLEEQWNDLQRDVQARTQAFAREFGLDTAKRLQPAKLMAQVRERLQQLQAGVDYLRQLLQALEDDPDTLKQWLKHERTWARQRDQ
ncbi:J domain-containing protein [Comamonas jiangduensis]|uniref:J domain-containing protein n=1 Tax=Comamonas jiangduensis TaxID=1194168 RepID=UPI0024E12C90|nr:J domain-containing protein [Comamonas jiangduensis]